MVSTTCQQFAQILGAKRDTNPGVCFVTRTRTDIKTKVMGRTTNSPTVFLMAFSFNNLSGTGKKLCLGEFVFRQTEVNSFLNAMKGKGIRITAIHNHWLLENPRLIYIHWEAVMEPLQFARISANAMNIAMGKK